MGGGIGGGVGVEGEQGSSSIEEIGVDVKSSRYLTFRVWGGVGRGIRGGVKGNEETGDRYQVITISYL